MEFLKFKDLVDLDSVRRIERGNCRFLPVFDQDLSRIPKLFRKGEQLGMSKIHDSNSHNAIDVVLRAPSTGMYRIERSKIVGLTSERFLNEALVEYYVPPQENLIPQSPNFDHVPAFNFSKKILGIPIELPIAHSRAELEISKTSYRIRCYFPGSDARYNGDFRYINGSDFNSFCSALRENRESIFEMSKLSLQGIYIRPGKSNMVLRTVNGKPQLYCFASIIHSDYISPISGSLLNSLESIDEFEKILLSAQEKAKKAQELF